MASTGARVVGKVAIKAIPDVSTFNEDLRRALRRERDQSVEVDAKLSEGSRQTLKRQLDALQKELNITVRLRNIRPDPAIARGRFKEQIEKLLGDTVVLVPVDLQITEKNLANLQHKINKFVRDNDGRNIKIEADAQTLFASRQLSWVARTRFVEYVATVNQASVASVASILAALSGGRLIKEFGTNLFDFFKDLDKNLPKVGTLFTAIIGLSGGLVGVISSVVSFTAGLSAMVPLLMVVPGFLMGTVAAIGLYAMAMADAKTELASLGPAMGELQDITSSAFWSEAKAPILDLVNNLMPQMRRSFEDVGGALGSFTGALATSFDKEFADGRFEAIFATMGEGFRILETGTDSFAGAIVSLAQIGGRYFPRFATWFVGLANQFDGWLEQVSNDGRLDGWIENAIQEVKFLGQGIASAGRAFKGVWEAAQAAGALGMQDFRDSMAAFDALVNSGKGQKAMRDWFQGGRAAADSIGRAIGHIMGGWADASDLVQRNFEAAGRTIEQAGKMLGRLFANRTLGVGIESMFDGFTSGLRTLEPAIDLLGEKFGTIAAFMGVMADAFAGPIRDAALLILPSADRIFRSMEPLVRELAGSLSDLLTSGDAEVLIDSLTTMFEWVTQLARVAVPALNFVLSAALELLAKLGPVGITAGLAFVGIGAAALRAAPHLLLIRTRLGEIQTGTGRVNGALRGLGGFLGGPWGVALGVATLGFLAFDDAIQRGVPTVQAIRDELERMPSISAALYEAADRSDFEEMLHGSYAVPLEDLSGLLEEHRGDWTDLWRMEFDELGAINSLERLGEAMSSLPIEEQRERFQELVEWKGLDAAESDELREIMGLSAAVMDEATEATERFMRSQEELADFMFAEQNAIAGYGDAVRDLVTTMMADDFAGFATVNGAFDLMQESGAAGARMFQDLVTSSNDASAAMADNNQSVAALKEQYLNAAREVQGWGTAAGLSQEEIDRLRGALVDMSSIDVDLEVDMNGDGVFNDLDRIEAQLLLMDEGLTLLDMDVDHDGIVTAAELAASEAAVAAGVAFAPEFENPFAIAGSPGAEWAEEATNAGTSAGHYYTSGAGAAIDGWDLPNPFTGFDPSLPGLEDGSSYGQNVGLGILGSQGVVDGSAGALGAGASGALGGAILPGFMGGALSAIAALTGSLNGGVGDASASGKALGEGSAAGMKNAKSSVERASAEIQKSMLKSIGGMHSTGVSVGASLGQGITAGIKGQVANIAAAAAAAVRAATASAKAAGEINSPSKLWAREIGSGLMEGGALGITQNAWRMQAAADSSIPHVTFAGVGASTGFGSGGGGALIGALHLEGSGNVESDMQTVMWELDKIKMGGR